MNKDSKLIAEAYFKKLYEGMNLPNLKPSNKDHFGDIMSGIDGAPNSFEEIPSPRNSNAYFDFIEKFLKEGGSETIADFLRNTKEDFSIKGNNEPAVTLRGLLKASKLQMDIPDHMGKKQPPKQLYGGTEISYTYMAGQVGVKFTKHFRKYIEDGDKKIKERGFDQDDESADRTDQARDDTSAIDHAREDKAAAEKDKWTQGQGKGGKFLF